jgi:hypothetical protein
MDLLVTAVNYRTTLYCKASNGSHTTLPTPILPSIHLLKEGIQNESLPYRKGSFDLVLSQHALNEGLRPSFLLFFFCFCAR